MQRIPASNVKDNRPAAEPNPIPGSGLSNLAIGRAALRMDMSMLQHRHSPNCAREITGRFKAESVA